MKRAIRGNEQQQFVLGRFLLILWNPDVAQPQANELTVTLADVFKGDFAILSGGSGIAYRDAQTLERSGDRPLKIHRANLVAQLLARGRLLDARVCLIQLQRCRVLVRCKGCESIVLGDGPVTSGSNDANRDLSVLRVLGLRPIDAVRDLVHEVVDECAERQVTEVSVQASQCPQGYEEYLARDAGEPDAVKR